MRLLADLGGYSQSVPHVDLQVGRIMWSGSMRDHDFAVVTTNARDFISLLKAPVHPGLNVLRENGLSRQEQWERLIPFSAGVFLFRTIHGLLKSSSTAFQSTTQLVGVAVVVTLW